MEVTSSADGQENGVTLVVITHGIGALQVLPQNVGFAHFIPGTPGEMTSVRAYSLDEPGDRKNAGRQYQRWFGLRVEGMGGP